jgi:uncharacterized protein (DUF302 family)
MTNQLDEYAFTVHLDADYEDALESTVAALKEQGFGIITQIDMKQTLKQKIGVDFRKYAILGACDPKLANRALSTEPEMGLLLPCNVVVYEDEDGAGGTTVSIVDPIGMLGSIEEPGLQQVADEAHAKLSKVAAALAG